MSVEEETFNALKSLVANRCHPVLAPQGTALPYITYQRLSAPREGTLNKSQTLSNVQLRVSAYAASHQAAHTLAASVRAAMKAAPLVINDLEDDSEFYEEETQLYSIDLIYSCWETE